ncbi:MAG: diguanylate cyclase [Nitrospirota bacterium]
MEGIEHMKANILIVDDAEITRKEIMSILKKAIMIDKFFEASDGLEALKILAKETIDLIFCDIMMPKMDGYKFLSVLNGNEEYKEIPVILVSSIDDSAGKVKGLELGAWDFISKPYHPLELTARAKAMLRIKNLQDKLKTRMRELEKLSIIDTLTGLYNKKYLNEYLKREIRRSEMYGVNISCIMMDVDHFKEVNDTFGHHKGDIILKELGYILGEMIRGYDFASRYGGDEFAIIVFQSNKAEVDVISERIRKTVENYKFAKKEGESIGGIYITVSLGSATFFRNKIKNYEELIVAADNALYLAKARGRNCAVSE